MDVNRRPTAVTYKSVLSVIWAPTALGLVPLPGSLANSPGIYGQTSAAAVVIGSLISIFGLTWHNRLTGLTVEQVGLIGIIGGTLMYFVALLTVDHWQQAMLAMGLSLAFAAGGIAQFILIWRFRRRWVTQP